MNVATQVRTTKGPLVWLDMDQPALDDAYDQMKWATNRDPVNDRIVSICEAARARLGEPLRLAYGPSPIEGLDVFKARKPNAPIGVFIHGGAWRQGEACNYAHPAEMLVDAGANLVVLDFTTVTATGGDLRPLVDQVRRAVAFVYKNARQFGGDPEQLYLFGHSSGGHLAGVVLVTEWEREFGLPASIIKGAVLSSGMYELEPVRRSKRSDYVTFTDEVVDALSSQRHLARINCPVTVLHGTCESPEFQRQARDFTAAMKAAGKQVELRVGPGYNHFEVLESFGSPYALAGRAVLHRMGLGPA